MEQKSELEIIHELLNYGFSPDAVIDLMNSRGTAVFSGSAMGPLVHIERDGAHFYCAYVEALAEALQGHSAENAAEESPKEIERKFLVRDTSILNGSVGATILQGYILDRHPTVRVRITGEARAYLTLKGPPAASLETIPAETEGGVPALARDEFEYAIPVAHARILLRDYARFGRIEKVRHEIWHADKKIEVDVFGGQLEGLVLAEVELKRVDEELTLPEWVGEEVTSDHRYANSCLAAATEPPLQLA